METLLLVLAIISLLAGLAGAVLPIPGPPLSFLGLLMLQWSRYVVMNDSVVWSLGIVTAVVAVLDYYIPVYGTKKFGGTRYGSIGTVAGMLIGLFVLPGIGLLLGAFLGAFAGELIGRAPWQTAMKAAIGSFLGFVTGIVMKVVLCLVMIGYAIISFF
ncbi:DUF456 domain-containing protein [Ravibacter arvi]|uniref:DUF456 domain-containing protein n=1 Tax=Ravibacter arvi TaxID=2051041 RepID=A0ABP8LRJ7_9BACT